MRTAQYVQMEQQLVKWFKNVPKPIHKKVIKEQAMQIHKRLYPDKMIFCASQKWFNGFVKRNAIDANEIADSRQVRRKAVKQEPNQLQTTWDSSPSFGVTEAQPPNVGDDDGYHENVVIWPRVEWNADDMAAVEAFWPEIEPYIQHAPAYMPSMDHILAYLTNGNLALLEVSNDTRAKLMHCDR